MASDELQQRVAESFDDYLGLGNRCADMPGFRLVRSPEAPSIYDANYASRVRAQTPEAIESVLEQARPVFAELSYGRFLSDPLTPASFEARLMLEGYRLETELELLLPGALRNQGPKLDIRLVESDEDWATVGRLSVMDYNEIALKEARPAYRDEVATALLGRRRAKSPEARTWLARVDASDCAYFSSWPGRNGIGKVEDLFTHPDYRGRGIATGLIAHCVGDARERGAGAIMIGARPDDTPKHMYRALGFEPCYVQCSWFKTVESPE